VDELSGIERPPRDRGVALIRASALPICCDMRTSSDLSVPRA
jgi:hypothetical protein